MKTPRKFILVGIVIELGLAGIAIVAAWIFRVPLWSAGETVSASAVSQGMLAVIPLLFLIYAMEHIPWEPLRELRRTVDQLLTRELVDAPLGSLLWISMAAGIGEEFLFRGFLQNGIAMMLPQNGVGTAFSVMLAAAVFGGLHCLSPLYVVLATLVGCYLGWLYVVTGNLLVPIVTHATYDYLALRYLVGDYRHRYPRDPASAFGQREGDSHGQ